MQEASVTLRNVSDMATEANPAFLEPCAKLPIPSLIRIMASWMK